MAGRKSRQIWEYGDFQTPTELVQRCLQTLVRLGVEPGSVLEPTCGKGEFLIGAAKTFRNAKRFLGVEINSDYLDELNQRLEAVPSAVPIETLHASFFDLDWDDLFAKLPEPVLLLGNPPWVTNSDLAMLQSTNLPEKSNFQGKRGLDAMTGKSNFDISEWMLIKQIEWLSGRTGAIAVLCKTAVARKVLAHAWKRNYPLTSAALYLIDARKYFDAAVDACFLVLRLSGTPRAQECHVYESLESSQHASTVGYYDKILVADAALFEKRRTLRGTDKSYVWRSGIKHDAAKVMELERHHGYFRNGHQEDVLLEENYVYPMFKSSDINGGRSPVSRKVMLVTQKNIGDDTATIQDTAPGTWNYLQQNAVALEKRASSIYRNRPPFSIFGVGEYTFAPWKVAISGFYKRFHFATVGPIQGRPAVFDDTVYFLPCASQAEALFISELLNSEAATEFYRSMTFWDDKRPITIDLLRRLNLYALACYLSREQEYVSFAGSGTPLLFDMFS